MRLATYIDQQQTRVGAVVGEQIYDLAACLQASGKGEAAQATSVLTLLAGGQSALDQVKAAVEWAQRQGEPALVQPLAAVKLQAPIPCPGKLLCLAGNYASHIEEGGGKFAGKEKMIPRFFSKPCTSVIGTGDAIRIPASTGFADWELELAVVIGKAGRNLTVAQAAEHIAGYTIFNDISARELTFRKDLPMQEGDWFFDWLVGKWLDTFGPMGPWLTTADEVPHPDNLRMQLWYNGQFISQFVTLQPGDIISTGTPAGVGLTKKLRLNPGDQIRGEIEGLGVLENSVERLE
jgi:2,4-didehydro-3-deoxy-L-rhamnonate hydrolase